MYVTTDLVEEAQTMWHEHVRLEAELADNARRIDVTLRMIDRGCKIASRRWEQQEITSGLAWGKRVERWQNRYKWLAEQNEKIAQEFYAIDTRHALLPCQCMFCNCTCNSDAYGVACPIHD